MNKIIYNVAWLILTTYAINSCQHSPQEQNKNEKEQIADSITKILSTSLKHINISNFKNFQIVLQYLIKIFLNKCTRLIIQIVGKI